MASGQGAPGAGRPSPAHGRRASPGARSAWHRPGGTALRLAQAGWRHVTSAEDWRSAEHAEGAGTAGLRRRARADCWQPAGRSLPSPIRTQLASAATRRSAIKHSLADIHARPRGVVAATAEPGKRPTAPLDDGAPARLSGAPGQGGRAGRRMTIAIEDFEGRHTGRHDRRGRGRTRARVRRPTGCWSISGRRSGASAARRSWCQLPAGGADRPPSGGGGHSPPRQIAKTVSEILVLGFRTRRARSCWSRRSGRCRMAAGSTE